MFEGLYLEDKIEILTEQLRIATEGLEKISNVRLADFDFGCLVHKERAQYAVRRFGHLKEIAENTLTKIKKAGE